MNSGAIIFSRTDSKRFPSKCFHYVSDYTLLELVIKRAQLADIGKVIVATTFRNVDDELADQALRFGAVVFRGDPENLVKRTCDVIDFYKLDSFCRLNGDSPFVDAELLRAGKKMLCGKINFVTNLIDRTFPYGVALEWVDSAVYKELANSAECDEVEHVTKHLYRLRHALNCKSLVNDQGNFSEIKLTIDYPEDLHKINFLLKNISKNILEIGYLDIVQKFKFDTQKNDNYI